MKRVICRAIIVFLIFFTGTAGVIAVDNICHETTGEGGKLSFNIDNERIFK